MRIFKGEIFQRVLSLSVLLVFIFTGAYLLGKILTPITYADYFNHDIEIIENNNEHVDIVFVGASRVYRTFVPKVFEDKLELNCVVNAGSSQQPICATYYQLKDLVGKLHPDCAIIDLSYNRLAGVPSRQGRMLVYDRLSFSNRVEYVLDCFEMKNIFYIINSYRFRNNLEDIPSIVAKKKLVVENNYQPDSSANEYYVDKGFVYSNQTYETGTIAIKDEMSYSEESIREENLRYLDACVKLCREEGIQLYLVTAPTSMMQIYSYQGDGFDEITKFCEQYADENNLIYHNLNYLVGREDFLPDEMMHDYNHVNGKGAHIISEIYAEILRKDMEGIDTSSYFYSDLSELRADVHRIVAVEAEIEQDENDNSITHINISSLQNNNIKPIYKVEISFDEGETYTTLSEWSAEQKIDVTIKEEQPYQLKISASSGNVNDVEAYQIYTL